MKSKHQYTVHSLKSTLVDSWPFLYVTSLLSPSPCDRSCVPPEKLARGCQTQGHWGRRAKTLSSSLLLNIRVIFHTLFQDTYVFQCYINVGLPILLSVYLLSSSSFTSSSFGKTQARALGCGPKDLGYPSMGGKSRTYRPNSGGLCLWISMVWLGDPGQ
jgi:hypothetical protein